MAGSIEWARQVRRELVDEIRNLTARARSGSHAMEALGFLPEQDHLQDLKRRLAQVERLVDAIPETEPVEGGGWPADLGDPSIGGADSVEPVHAKRRPS